MSIDTNCELCEATPFTEWFHADDLCWIAECDACGVPMVVWRVHDPSPPDEIRRELHGRLDEVMTARSADPYWIDDNMRSIPDHYHAHARRRIDWKRRP
jgi:hypothetical protein